MSKAKLLKMAAVFERQAVMLLKEARRLRALAEHNKRPVSEAYEQSLTVH